MSLNKVMLIGNVGQEPTVRYLDSGVCVASVRLATTDRGYTMRDGTQVPERAEWHSLIFWDKLAETVEKYVHKGDKLYVEGKIQTRSFVDKQGMTRQVIEIMVNNMEMLTPKSAATPAPQGGVGSYQQQAAPQPAVNVSDNDEDVPF
ncbi:MAG: single-stranded DNA-binding protein [Bacteroidaceae bacterium]|nr:single-stranded DNA-binding protein [Bacteroidaceae bacterium]MCR4837238.1 single-stranded DNA-binding protein [Bacteroidaceae bacterium]